MAESSVVKNNRDAVLSFSDGTTPTALTYTVQHEPGDLTYNRARNRDDYLDRGELVGSAREGDEEGVSGSFSAYLRQFTDATEATLLDVLENDGYVGANWTSTLGTASDLTTWDLIYLVEGSDFGDGADHSLTFGDCSFDYGFTEGRPSAYAINFRSHTATAPTAA